MAFTVTVCIPHADTPWLLATCLDCISGRQHPDIAVDVIVADQTQDVEVHKRVCEVVARSGLKARLIHCRLLGCGHGIDCALKFATGEFFCTLDCDAWPIHKAWLSLPIALIREGVAQWVGSDTGLSKSYTEKGPFVHLNNYYRISRTDNARVVSRNVGFMRWDSRWEIGFVPADYYWESLGGKVKCDNGVIAMHHTREHSKVSLAINRVIGQTPTAGVYGMVIDDLVFHLVFARNARQCQDMNAALGGDYADLYRSLEVHDRPLILAEVSELAKRARGDGTFNRSLSGLTMSADLARRIEELKA